MFGKKKICRRLNDILGVKSTSQMQMLSFGGQFNPWWVLNSMSCTTMIYSGDFFYSALSHVSLNRGILTREGKKGEGDTCLLSDACNHGVSLQLKTQYITRRFLCRRIFSCNLGEVMGDQQGLHKVCVCAPKHGRNAAALLRYRVTGGETAVLVLTCHL